MTQGNTISLRGVLNGLILVSPYLFPFYLLKFQIYGIPVTALELFTYGLFLLWFFNKIRSRVPISWVKPLRYYWMLGFLIFIGSSIGVLVSPHYMSLPSGEVLDSQRVALGVWKGWVLAPMLYFAVLTQSVRTEKGVSKLLHSFVYSGALVSLSAYFLGVLGVGFTYDFRLSGFFASANYLSLYIGPALVLSIMFLMKEKGKNPQTHYCDLASMVIMAHALFFTKSYAAILGVFGALFLYMGYMLLRAKVNLKKLVFGFLAVFFIFSVLLYTQIHTPKFQQFLDLENRSSSSVRLEVYEIAWGLIGDKPLTGIGPGLFQAFYQTRGPEILEHPPMEWNIPHPHNLFFAFWLNTGLIGLLALLGIIVLIHFPVVYPLVAMWGILIHGIFDTPFWKNDLAMIFWLILASIVILQTYASHSDQSEQGPVRKRLAPKLVRRSK